MTSNTKDKIKKSHQQPDSPILLFAVSSLDLGWRLAVAVMISIVGGYYLDQSLKTEPVFLVLGGIFCLASTTVIIKSYVKKINEKMGV